MTRKLLEVDRTYFNSRLDFHHLKDIKHLGAGLERFIWDYCADRPVETVWVVGLQLGEV
jgi:hypothetical protein